MSLNVRLHQQANLIKQRRVLAWSRRVVLIQLEQKRHAHGIVLEALLAVSGRPPSFTSRRLMPPTEFADYLADLRQRFRAKRNFINLLDEMIA